MVVIFLLRKKQTICIFPEGKRTRDGRMNPARGGLGYLVHTTGATVVPIAIDTFVNMSMRDFFTFQRKIILTVGAPMYPNDIITIQNPTVTDYQDASQKVLDRIEALMG
jgi:1-acyl-sn-glycerol-3-phosphate acyltransferase